jgi:outer membrane protein TolC
MKRKHHVNFIFSSVLLTACCILPTFSQRIDTLSLQQTIALAQKNNLLIMAGELGVKQSESRLREVKAMRFPVVSFHSHYLHAPENGYNEIVTNGGEYGVQVISTLPLYDGGMKSTLVDQSLNARERSSLSLQKSKIEIAFTVRTLYFEILRVEEEIRIRKETIERLEDYVVFLNQLRLGGNATESDLLKAQVDLNTAKISFDQAQQSLEKSKLILFNATGSGTDRTFEIVPVADDGTSNMPAFSLEHNPDLQLLQHEKMAAGYDVTIASAERLPTLSISADAGALGVTPSEFHHDIGYSILLSLDMPLFSWGAIDNRIEQKELARDQLDAQLKLQQRELETEWRMTVSDFELAKKNLVSYTVNSTNAEQNYLSAKSRFAGGSGSNLEVLDAQRLLVETKLNCNTTRFQLRESHAVLLKLSGQE